MKKSTGPFYMYAGFRITSEQPYLRQQKVLVGYVQILLLGHKQTSRISRCMSDFRAAGVRPLSGRQQTGKHYTFPRVQAQQHRVMITSSQQPVSHARLSSHCNQRQVGLVWQPDRRIGPKCSAHCHCHGPRAVTLQSVLMSQVINTPCSRMLQPLCRGQHTMTPTAKSHIGNRLVPKWMTLAVFKGHIKVMSTTALHSTLMKF